MENNYLKMIGEKFRQNKKTKALFRCQCGVEKIIDVQSVKSGTTKSCGCYNRKAASKRMLAANSVNSHGLTEHPLYNSWKSMKTRCLNENSPEYFGGNILICDKWINDFKSFYDWAITLWKENLVLRRVDESIGFNPDNCYFGVRPENSNPEKARATMLERYGVTSALQLPEVRAKVIETSKKKYGTNYPCQNKDVISKIEETNLIKYGFRRASDNEAVKAKMAETNIKRYGFKSPSQNVEIRAKQVASIAANPNGHKYNYTSSAEQHLKEWILKECGLEFNSEWELLDGQQVDLFNEKLKLGIEYCGLYWHNESKNKGRLYHYNKYKILQEKGIRLLTIFSDEWKYRNTQVKNFLKGVLGKNKYRVQARECEVKEVDAKIAEDFIEKHHIQGSRRTSLISFGLFTGYGLVGVMSFNKHHRQNHNSSLILNRMCFADDTTIVGGASRMLKQGRMWAENNGYKEIISWSDNRWSTGGVYNIMGFELDGELGPDYSYVNESNAKVRIAKQKMTKKNIGCPTEIKEHDFLAKEGYYRIWDCGKKRWKIDLEKSNEE